MIFWDKITIMSGTNASITLTASGANQLTTTGNLTVNSLNVNGSLTLTNSVTLPTGSHFNGPVTLPTGSGFADKVILRSGSGFEGPVTLPSLSGIDQVITVTGTETSGSFATVSATTGTITNATINNLAMPLDGRAQLPANTTIGGRNIISQGNTGYMWLDAYQGPGDNWIKIANLSDEPLILSELTFSGNRWENITINPAAQWEQKAYDGWGSNDSPMDITYKIQGNSDLQTIPVAEWNAWGGVYKVINNDSVNILCLFLARSGYYWSFFFSPGPAQAIGKRTLIGEALATAGKTSVSDIETVYYQYKSSTAIYETSKSGVDFDSDDITFPISGSCVTFKMKP